MLRVHLFVISAVAVVYLQGTFANPIPQDEDYASYATLYPEIAKKIGEEPIEILDVVKAVLVYDSDDTTPTPTEQTSEPESEVINSADYPPENFQRIMKKQA